MKKHIIILIVILTVSAGFLSGCNQKEGQKIDLTKVEIVDYTIKTQTDWLGEEFKNISGFLINNAGKKIYRIEIEAKFYDNDSNYIRSKYSYIYDLANKKTDDFQFIYHSVNDYYYQVDWNNIQFNINITENKT
jgi:hypothetical protein